jgi:hypothetical protein
VLCSLGEEAMYDIEECECYLLVIFIRSTFPLLDVIRRASCEGQQDIGLS